jgi:hypothetical protein
MDKKVLLVLIGVFAIGLGTGLVISAKRIQSQHIKTEYFIELKYDYVLIEDTHGNIISCPYEKISQTLIKDNL